MPKPMGKGYAVDRPRARLSMLYHPQTHPDQRRLSIVFVEGEIMWWMAPSW